MVEDNNRILVDKYISMLFRHKLLLCFCILVVGITGSLSTLLLKDIYASNTLILVEPQKIPESYVRATVTSGVADRLNSITKQVMSRTRLQRIIDEFGLYKNYKNRWQKAIRLIPWLRNIDWIEKKSRKKPTKESIINLMRQNIAVDVRNFGAGKTNYFAISFTGTDPKTVMDVTNKLASLYIEENLKAREVQVKGTTDFLEKELENIRKQLEEKEAAVTKYKIANKGELPQQQISNLRIMDQIQVRLQTVDESIAAALSREMLLKNRLDTINSATPNINQNTNTPKQKTVNPLEAQLAQLKARLEEMRTIYTQNHPDIKKLKRTILNIKKKIKLDRKNKIKSVKPDATTKPKAPSNNTLNPLYQTMKLDLDKVQMDIKSLRKEKKKLKKQFRVLKARVDKIPDKELELTTLTRDYEILKENYKDMLRKKLQARLSENLERKQKGEQFRILDPANFPEKPFKPNRKKISILSFIAGLILGIGIILLMEYLNNTFAVPEEVEEFTDLPVIAIIPSIKN